MSVIVTGINMPDDCFDCERREKCCGNSCSIQHRKADCPLKSVEGLIEKLEEEKMLYTRTVADDNPIDYGVRIGLSKAIKIIKQYCGIRMVSK